MNNVCMALLINLFSCALHHERLFLFLRNPRATAVECYQLFCTFPYAAQTIDQIITIYFKKQLINHNNWSSKQLATGIWPFFLEALQDDHEVLKVTIAIWFSSRI